MVDALKNLYKALGGSASDVSDENTNNGMINAIAGYIGIKDVNVQPEKSTATLFGTKVSAMQSGVVVADGAITGTLKFIQGGIAESGPLAGDGNFMALKFVDPNDCETVAVGLDPSAGTGMVELDSDMNGVFKISATTQVLKVVATKNGVARTQTFDLTGLTLEAE